MSLDTDLDSEILARLSIAESQRDQYMRASGSLHAQIVKEAHQAAAMKKSRDSAHERLAAAESLIATLTAAATRVFECWYGEPDCADCADEDGWCEHHWDEYKASQDALREALRAGDGSSAPVEVEASLPLEGVPDDLAKLIRDPNIIVPQDAAVFELVSRWMNAPSDTASAAPCPENDPHCDGVTVRPPASAEYHDYPCPASASTPSASPDLASLVDSLTQERDEARRENVSYAARLAESRRMYDIRRELQEAAEAQVAVYRQALEHFVAVDQDCANLADVGELTDADDKRYGEAKEGLSRALAAVVVEQPPDGQGLGGRSAPLVEEGEGG